MISDFFITTSDAIQHPDVVDFIYAGPVVKAKWVGPEKIDRLEEIIFSLGYAQQTKSRNLALAREFEDGESQICEVNPTLTRIILNLTPQQNQHIAQKWANTEEWKLYDGRPDELYQLLQDLVALIQRYLTQDTALYVLYS